MKTNAPRFFRGSILLAITLLLAALVAAYFALQSEKISSSARAYSIGDIAAEDVVASENLTWVDLQETEAQRRKELSKGPVLFRFDESTAAAAVARFEKDYAFMRESFLENVDKTFNTRALDTNQLEGPLFRELVVDFRSKHAPFPITLIKGSRWVQEVSEEKFLKELAGKLRAASGKFVHRDGWDDAAHGDHLRVISSAELSRTNVNLLKQSHLIRRATVFGITKVRNDLRGTFPKEQQATATYLAGFVEVNCVFDKELTQRLRMERAEAIHVVNSLKAGEMIVERGERINARMKGALDELKMRSPSVVSKTNGSNKIWFWSASIFLILLALVFFLRGASGPGNQLVSTQNVVALPSIGFEAQTLETKLMPHLARGLMNRFVRALISQRAELIQTSDTGTEQLNELEDQLEKITTRLQTRQSVYERRIAELEKELAAAEEENRELIRAKLYETRQNLEWARAQRQ
ncbi:MAG: hypothetical protein ABI042_10470 [Verrucomicrobiota bacterium]